MSRQAIVAAPMLAMMLAACGGAAAAPPQPPTITKVGVVTNLEIHQDYIRYTFADGSIEEIPPSYRALTNDGWGGFGLAVLGSDADGPFVAAFPTQDGLPPNCYVENGEGVERGSYVQIHGVLWRKGSGFSADPLPADGAAYPAGTRFCFDEAGSISATIDR
jgi:hypothetical protein